MLTPVLPVVCCSLETASRMKMQHLRRGEEHVIWLTSMDAPRSCILLYGNAEARPFNLATAPVLNFTEGSVVGNLGPRQGCAYITNRSRQGRATLRLRLLQPPRLLVSRTANGDASSARTRCATTSTCTTKSSSPVRLTTSWSRKVTFGRPVRGCRPSPMGQNVRAREVCGLPPPSSLRAGRDYRPRGSSTQSFVSNR